MRLHRRHTIIAPPVVHVDGPTCGHKTHVGPCPACQCFALERDRRYRLQAERARVAWARREQPRL